MYISISLPSINDLLLPGFTSLYNTLAQFLAIQKTATFPNYSINDFFHFCAKSYISTNQAQSL
jgi:hypothetical protein